MIETEPVRGRVHEGQERDAAWTHRQEVRHGERFEFGKNWERFLRLLNDERIASAEQSLRTMLGLASLSGRTFLDVGSGSGLFSLAARRLGARVHSFDYDPQSVACTEALRHRYAGDDPDWRIEQRSALDESYMSAIGPYDVVYSWGVLHHTGAMWRGLEYVHRSVAPGGLLFVAIYNDTGTQSRRWRWIKRMYNRLPRALRIPYVMAVSAPGELRTALRHALTGRLGDYVRLWTTAAARGQNRWRDIVDWVGGYPYEVAKPEEIVDFYLARHFTLRRIRCGNTGTGCNEYVFEKREA